MISSSRIPLYHVPNFVLQTGFGSRVCIKTHAYISTLKGYLILHSFLGRRGGFTIGKIFPVLLYDKWAGEWWHFFMEFLGPFLIFWTTKLTATHLSNEPKTGQRDYSNPSYFLQSQFSQTYLLQGLPHNHIPIFPCAFWSNFCSTISTSSPT